MQREAELRERERASIFFETWIKPFINQEYLLDFFTYEINKFHIPFFFLCLIQFLSIGKESPGPQF